MDDVIALFHRYKDPVYRLALSFTGSAADAEDVTQTVFLKYLETQPELEVGMGIPNFPQTAPLPAPPSWTPACTPSGLRSYRSLFTGQLAPTSPMRPLFAAGWERTSPGTRSRAL